MTCAAPGIVQNGSTVLAGDDMTSATTRAGSWIAAPSSCSSSQASARRRRGALPLRGSRSLSETTPTTSPAAETTGSPEISRSTSRRAAAFNDMSGRATATSVLMMSSTRMTGLSWGATAAETAVSRVAGRRSTDARPRRGGDRARMPTALLDAPAAAPAEGEELHRGAEADALAALGSGPAGLSSEEARARLARYGPNRLPELRRRSPLLRLLAQFRDFFAILLEVAGTITLVTALVEHDAQNLKVAIAIFAVVVLNAIIGFTQEYRAERTAEALKRMLPARARVLRDGQPEDVAAEELVPGDVVCWPRATRSRLTAG